jgi:hypothetical protein
MVAAFQLLQILIVDQAFLPKVGEEMEVRARCTQVLTIFKVSVRQVLHFASPCF